MPGPHKAAAAARGACAIVVTPLANLHAGPDHRAELTSQRLHGELVRVLGRNGHWFLTAGWDGYRGWTRSWSLLLVAERSARSWDGAARACAWRHTVEVLGAPSSNAEIRALVPWGARLAPWSESSGLTRDWVAVRLPEGGIGYVRARDLGPAWPRQLPASDRRTRVGRRAAMLARAQCGAPYLWGGTSSWGFDCSGLVQWAFAMGGLALPRDARDQIRLARPLNRREPPLPGDLLFFGRDGAVNHVAILSAPPRFVHAYGRVEEATLSGPGANARPELRAICLGPHRLVAAAGTRIAGPRPQRGRQRPPTHPS